MRVTSLLAAGALFLIVAPESVASAAVIDVPVTPLVVRLYGPLPPSETQSALDEARTILAHAGFAPEWIACPPDAAPRRCTVPLDRAELAVRLATAPPQSPSLLPLPLGYSLVDSATQSGALATIYLDRVRWLAAAAATNVAALLGRAIAHELGHLLLGTPQHGRFGLMRAVWSHQMVRNSRPHEWRFSVREAQQMRGVALARAGGAGREDTARVVGSEAVTVTH
jgi:hypothetical protein